MPGGIACKAERPQQEAGAGLLGEARMAEPGNGVRSRSERLCDAENTIGHGASRAHGVTIVL